MQDLDFDEIDRAVNGALDGAQPTVPAQAPQVAEPVAASEPAQPVATPAARRTSGRFMDVVHPSSDMRARSVAAPREAAPVPVEPVASAEPELPLEEPQTSPFLPDAKVEKRPLGGVGPALVAPEAPSAYGGVAEAEAPAFALPPEPAQELIEAPDDPRLEAETLPDPIDFAHQLNTELTVEPELEPQPQPVEEAVVLPEEPETLEEPALDLTPPVAPTPEAPVAEEPVGPTSITQQYIEQPSSSAESGAIFDTEAYHQPVAAPVKKKSGGLVILWIALLLIFGAGVGVAIYYFVLPML